MFKSMTLYYIFLNDFSKWLILLNDKNIFSTIIQKLIWTVQYKQQNTVKPAEGAVLNKVLL